MVDGVWTSSSLLLLGAFIDHRCFGRGLGSIATLFGHGPPPFGRSGVCCPERGLALVAIPPAVAVAAGSIARPAPLLEARRAIHRLVVAGLKRYLGGLTAARARHLEHLTRATCVGRPSGPITAVRRRPAPVTLRLAAGATIGTPTRLAEASAGVEVLLATGERECLAAVAAGQSGISRHRRRLPSKHNSSAAGQGRAKNTGLRQKGPRWTGDSAAEHVGQRLQYDTSGAATEVFANPDETRGCCLAPAEDERARLTALARGRVKRGIAGQRAALRLY